MYEKLSKLLPEARIGIAHGQLKEKELECVMQDFHQQRINILLCSTIIETGIDIPSANTIIMNRADKFGLAQLHQLRGRVGRGSDQSYCILMSGSKLSEEGKTRLQTMVKTNDGFEIAEVDLRLRGPGNLMGTQQSGILELKIADVIKDSSLLKVARDTAQQIIKKDPNFIGLEHQVIKRTLSSLKIDSNIWNFIS